MKNQIQLIILSLFLSFSTYGQTDTLEKIKNSKIKKNISVSSQIEIDNKSFNKLVENLSNQDKEKKTAWDTLFPLIIGALLTLVPQIIFWFLNKSKEKSKQKLEIKANINRLEYLLYDHYRELAMYKSHKYYWYAHFEKSEREDNNEETKEFYKLHTESDNKVRETEIKISSTFSEFYGFVIKFQHLTAFNDKIDSLINEYYHFEPIKPNEIDSTKHNFKEEANIEEKSLREDYLGFINPIKKIVQYVNQK